MVSACGVPVGCTRPHKPSLPVVCLPVQPLGVPQALFSPEALSDRNVRWESHGCKSYDCLRARPKGACLGCFDLAAEEGRWQGAPAQGDGSQNDTVTMSQVVAGKKGALR